MSGIAITTECVCDLSKKFLAEYNIDVIYFDIVTEEGSFRDTEEIDAINVIEYINRGKKVRSHAPTANMYKKFFEKQLDEYDEVIHLCISSELSRAYEYATLSTAKIGMDARRIHIVDTRSISACLGILAIKAAAARDAGMDANGILRVINECMTKTYTTMIAKNADYLYYCGKVSERVMNLCRRFNMHPVLVMKDGKLVINRIMFGNYRNAYMTFLKDELRKTEKIDRDLGFICYAGCPKEMRERITAFSEQKHVFNEVHYSIVGATISVNSGPESYSIQYLKK